MTASTSRNRPGNAVGQGPGIAASAALHVAVIAAAAIVWSQSRNLPDVTSTEIPVEMVDISELTNLRETQREEPKPVEQPLEEIVPTPALNIPKPPTPMPPPPQEQPAPEPEETVAQDEPEAVPPPPVQKPRPTPPKPDRRAADFDKILNSVLADNRPQQRAPSTAPRAERTQRGIGDMNAATADIRAAFLQQMGECWNFPAGAPHPEELVVEMNIRLTKDGHIVGTPELSAFTQAAMNHNRYMQAAGDAALRAVRICEPYRLPADRYAQWQELTLIFDPTKMVGR